MTNGDEGNQIQAQDASKVDFREKSYCAHILCEQEEVSCKRGLYKPLHTCLSPKQKEDIIR